MTEPREHRLARAVERNLASSPSMEQHALRVAVASVHSYRDCLRAALDQMHLMQRTIDRQRDEIAEMREERARLARSVFQP